MAHDPEGPMFNEWIVPPQHVCKPPEDVDSNTHVGAVWMCGQCDLTWSFVAYTKVVTTSGAYGNYGYGGGAAGGSYSGGSSGYSVGVGGAASAYSQTVHAGYRWERAWLEGDEWVTNSTRIARAQREADKIRAEQQAEEDRIRKVVEKVLNERVVERAANKGELSSKKSKKFWYQK